MRIWVTGIGIVSPLARGARATMDRLLAGDRAIGPLSLFHLEGSRSDVAAEVKGLEAEEEGCSRTDAMSVLAAREALAEAGVDPRAAPVDLVVGGSTAGMFETELTLAAFARDPGSIGPLLSMRSHPLSSTADRVIAALGPFHAARTLCSACSGGANAVLLGAAWIRAGRARCVLAGGADALSRLTRSGFGALAALSPEPCRPFDRRRAGLTLGEGAAFLVLEPEGPARARGARPIVELRGWAVGAEAHHITNPEAGGETAARVMRAALARAGLEPAGVDYVNAHGTATPLNDVMETAALERCLGAEASRVAVSSSKGQIGHTLAAAGAVEAAITAMAIARGMLPPTIGLDEIDPACRLVHVTRARPARIRAAMSDSFGFGGTDTALVLAEPGAFGEPDAAPPRGVVVTGAGTVGPLGVLGVAASGAYLEPGPPPPPGPIPFQPSAHLDVARARRLDRAARLVTAAVAAAMEGTGLPLDGDAANATGAVLGSAFGSVDGSAAFMRRVCDKGPRLASPADFPNLVPSSPAGHASIYHGLRGPVLAVADLSATAECAIATAIELCAAGEADAVFAGSVEEASPIVDLCLAPVCSPVADRGPRSEGASVLLLEAEDRAAARGARILARVVWWASWRSSAVPRPLVDAPPPDPGWGPRVVVVSGRNDDRVARALEGSRWAEVPRRSVAARAGDHEGAGGFAAAAAVSALAAGALDAALVVGTAPDRGHAVLLVRAQG
jgi:3-oxoacyl-[acyl-carrier-protein] synthase II